MRGGWYFYRNERSGCRTLYQRINTNRCKFLRRTPLFHKMVHAVFVFRFYFRWCENSCKSVARTDVTTISTSKTAIYGMRILFNWHDIRVCGKQMTIIHLIRLHLLIISFHCFRFVGPWQHFWWFYSNLTMDNFDLSIFPSFITLKCRFDSTHHQPAQKKIINIVNNPLISPTCFETCCLQVNFWGICKIFEIWQLHWISFSENS